MAEITNGNGNGRFSMKISLGNLLTIAGGVCFAAIILVNITQAYDKLDKKLSLLSMHVRSIERVLHLPASDGEEP